MAGGLLSLKWNNHCSTFLHILSNLHKKQTYHDATVACGGILYPVHKIVLSTCSEYFEEMFDSIYDKHPIIVLKDIKGEVFEALLKYMYIGEVNVVQDRLSDLINAAECLKIKGLAVPDEDPSGGKVRSNKTSAGGSGISSKRRLEQLDTSEVAPPSKVHKAIKSVSNNNGSSSSGVSSGPTPTSSSKSDPKNSSRESSGRGRSDSIPPQEDSLFPEDDEIIEEIPVKQEQEDYEESVSITNLTKEKQRLEQQQQSDSNKSQQPPATDQDNVDAEEMSKVEMVDDEGESNSTDQWNAAHAGDEGDNFGYHGDSNSGGAEEMMGRGQEDGGDNNDGNLSFETSHHIPSTSFFSQMLPQQYPPTHSRQTSYNVSQYQQSMTYDDVVSPIQSTASSSSSDQFTKIDNVYHCSTMSCTYASPARSNMVLHIRSHTGERPYACTSCPYRATNKSNLNAHLRQHTGEYRFFCEFCPFKAKYKAGLRYHVENHHHKKN